MRWKIVSCVIFLKYQVRLQVKGFTIDIESITRVEKSIARFQNELTCQDDGLLEGKRFHPTKVMPDAREPWTRYITTTTRLRLRHSQRRTIIANIVEE